MVQNTLGKQWASIVSQFEHAEQVQRKCNVETAAAGYDVDDYNAARLRVLELGLAQAKDQHRTHRFKFWALSPVTTNQLLVHFLLVLQEQIETQESLSPSYRSGMMTAMENWVNAICMGDEKAREILNVGWDTNRVL